MKNPRDSDRQYLYFIEVAFGLHKIGITGNIENRLRRLQKLNRKRPVRIHAIIHAKDVDRLEKRILKAYSDRRISYRRFRGSGATEVMRLSWLHCYDILLKIHVHKHRGKYRAAIAVGLLAGVYFLT